MSARFVVRAVLVGGRDTLMRRVRGLAEAQKHQATLTQYGWSVTIEDDPSSHSSTEEEDHTWPTSP